MHCTPNYTTYQPRDIYSFYFTVEDSCSTSGITSGCTRVKGTAGTSPSPLSANRCPQDMSSILKASKVTWSSGDISSVWVELVRWSRVWMELPFAPNSELVAAWEHAGKGSTLLNKPDYPRANQTIHKTHTTTPNTDVEVTRVEIQMNILKWVYQFSNGFCVGTNVWAGELRFGDRVARGKRNTPAMLRAHQLLLLLQARLRHLQ